MESLVLPVQALSPLLLATAGPWLGYAPVSGHDGVSEASVGRTIAATPSGSRLPCPVVRLVIYWNFLSYFFIFFSTNCNVRSLDYRSRGKGH